jgi:hypothetical protein
MSRQFTKLDNNIGDTLVNTIIFQYWERKNLITVYISPIGAYCRYNSLAEFVRYPIFDTQVATPALLLNEQLKAFAVNMLPTEQKAIPDVGHSALHLLKTNGWESVEIRQSNATSLPEWLQIIDLDKNIATIYKKQLPLYDRC